MLLFWYYIYFSPFMSVLFSSLVYFCFSVNMLFWVLFIAVVFVSVVYCSFCFAFYFKVLYVLSFSLFCRWFCWKIRAGNYLPFFVNEKKSHNVWMCLPYIIYGRVISFLCNSQFLYTNRQHLVYRPAVAVTVIYTHFNETFD